MPPSPCTPSTITAAGSFRPLPESSSSFSKYMKSGIAPSKYLSYGIGVACTSGMPAAPRFIELPVTDSAPSVMPWNALVKLMTDSLPVTLRASFSAASTAFAPPGPGKTIL